LLSLLFGIAFPLILPYDTESLPLNLVGRRISGLMDAFSVWVYDRSSVFPTAIASYSLVGEKSARKAWNRFWYAMTDGVICWAPKHFSAHRAFSGHL
jgi:hypothetical protein